MITGTTDVKLSLYSGCSWNCRPGNVVDVSCIAVLMLGRRVSRPMRDSGCYPGELELAPAMETSA